MSPQDLDRLTDLLLEIGGRSPWVLLWEDGEPRLVVGSLEPREVPQLLCNHLLRILRGELGPEDAVVVEH